MKNVGAILPLAPHIEALALPNQSERATKDPTLECIYAPTTLCAKRHRHAVRRTIHAHGHLLLPCSSTDLKVAKFRCVKNKASTNAFHKYCSCFLRLSSHCGSMGKSSQKDGDMQIKAKEKHKTCVRSGYLTEW